ncbi:MULTISPECIES: HesA/MoeB/ThiF family protein [Acidianus]|uniref:Thiamine biosynthesis protein ThiF n=1 Tax=Candidatus Acidianus copahuensis TaxID=1160895 RepID=A0A031LPM9_9CREN|nr:MULTISPECIES: HesA/MoeB/ThiF family protein [Acidianus]EZQ06956.1 thiamine biosynthesis protein ThiF [Candidatus Acidianus copahuensis]NON62350.1 HesA/MoeB/ThiF family protein [Acidianus sp. RZ1]
MERYSRQLLALGIDVQERIMESKVAVVGCGALGSSLAELLGRLGVGEITIIDADIVEMSNLHRTHLFTEKDLMRPKAIVCKEKIEEINSEVKINAVLDIVDQTNALDIVKGKDIVFDALDSVNYRLILNDACVANKVPLIYAGISGEYGTVKLIVPGKTSCLSCFMTPGEGSNSCEIIGTTSIVPTVMASLQVQLYLNYLRREVQDEMILFDFRTMNMEKVKINMNPNCEACALHEYIYIKENISQSCGISRISNETLSEDSSSEIKISKTQDGLTICYGSKCFKKRV